MLPKLCESTVSCNDYLVIFLSKLLNFSAKLKFQTKSIQSKLLKFSENNLRNKSEKRKWFFN